MSQVSQKSPFSTTPPRFSSYVSTSAGDIDIFLTTLKFFSPGDLRPFQYPLLFFSSLGGAGRGSLLFRENIAVYPEGRVLPPK